MIIKKYTLINFIVFLVAVIFLLFSPLSLYVNFLAVLFFGIATIMLAISITKDYKNSKSQTSLKEKEILLELATEEGGEQYVFKNSRASKSRNRQIKSYFRDRLTTVIVVWFIGIMLLYFAIRLLFII